MQIDFSKVMTDLAGAPIKRGGEDNKDATLGLLAVDALLAAFPDEQQLSGEDKVKRADLAEKAYKQEVIDLSVEDVALIKKLIGKAFSPLAVKRAYEAIGS